MRKMKTYFPIIQVFILGSLFVLFAGLFFVSLETDSLMFKCFTLLYLVLLYFSTENAVGELKRQI